MEVYLGESRTHIVSPSIFMPPECLKEVRIETHYSTSRNDLVEEFYSPCAIRSTSYDRAVGYFRNSVIVLVRKSIASLARKGGKIRLICSPDLTEDEVLSFESGYDWRTKINETILATIEKALVDEYQGPSWGFIATLIANNNLDIHIAFRPNSSGIFHDKLGIFTDSHGDSVSFIGSANETISAWDIFGNHESIEVFCSWTADYERVRQHISYFDRLWNNIEPGVETIPFPQVARGRLAVAANPRGIEAAFDCATSYESKLHFPTPQLHQVRAISNWETNRFSGILAHATGSGKTITALFAISDWMESHGPVLILVPSELLLIQWAVEIDKFFAGKIPSRMTVGGGSTYWTKSDVIEGFTQSSGPPRIIVATIQTACKTEFLNRIIDGKHLLLVWDEVHWAGAPLYSGIFRLKAGGRLGLSATPKRYGDPEGTQKILDYFNGVVDVFNLADAIEAKRLCRYNYYVHPVQLTSEESKDWEKTTVEIHRGFARLKKADKALKNWPNYLKLLAIKRAKIVRQAHAKVELAANILSQYYSEGSRWLVYCDDQQQLGLVANAIRGKGLICSEYYSQMSGDRESTLQRLESLGGIIVAIKCLDEGVNIPSLTHALILASSRNPREYIQRRGRILRTSPEKYFAEIHDALVTPPSVELEGEPQDFSILVTELARAIRFSKNASNQSSLYSLFEIADKCGLKNVEELADAGIEEDNDA